MHRRTLLASLTPATALLAAGCIGDTGPAAAADTPAASPGDRRDDTDELAFLTLDLGCRGPFAGLDPRPLTPVDDAPPTDLSGFLATGLDDVAVTASAVAGCPVIDAAHDPHRDDPGAFIAETDFQFSFLVGLAGDGIDAIEINYVGLDPDGTAYLETTVTPGAAAVTAFARVGSFSAPDGLRVGLVDPDGDGTPLVYELDEA